jgi:hypothetical protein
METTKWKRARGLILRGIPPGDRGERLEAARRWAAARGEPLGRAHLADLGIPVARDEALLRETARSWRDGDLSLSDFYPKDYTPSVEELTALHPHAPFGYIDLMEFPGACVYAVMRRLGMSMPFDAFVHNNSWLTGAPPSEVLHLVTDVVSPPDEEDGPAAILRVHLRYPYVPEGMAYYLRACKAYGFQPGISRVAALNAGFFDRDLYYAVESEGGGVTSRQVVDHGFAPDVLVEHMIRRACPFLWSLGPGELGERFWDVFRAKRRIRLVQRWMRRRFVERRARTIQRAWRNAVTDPSRGPARKRLRREFTEIAGGGGGV